MTALHEWGICDIQKRLTKGGDLYANIKSIKTIYTIGHSTRTIEEFIEILKRYSIEQVVDIRTIPRSRANPQFNYEELERVLPEAGISYIYAKDLGGLHKPRKDSPNTGWRNDSFRGFADYMQTLEFSNAIQSLMELAEQKTTVIMCAEVLPWRCHRSLIADALVIRGYDIVEIFDKKKFRTHKLTSFAVVDREKITYPSDEANHR